MKAGSVAFCVLALLLGNAVAHSERNSKGRVASICTKNACVIEPEVTEGPYYYDTEYVRDDITEGMPGIQLNLTVNVLDIATCSPIENAAIDIWHCDASGVYSWFVNEQNPAPVNSTFLRGIVLTDSYGSATFKTIYPGWYIGRATHIHVKVHINGSDTNGLYTGGSVSLTSQFFFNDDISDQIYENDLYSGEPTSVSRVLNSQDSIYNEMNGMGMLDITMMDPSQGYAGGVYGKITIVVDTSASSTGGSTGNGGSPAPSGQPARPSGNPPSGVPPPPQNGGTGSTHSAPTGSAPSGQPPRPSGNAPSGVPPPHPSGQPPRPSGNPPSGQPPRPSGNAPSVVPPPPANDSVVGEQRSQQPSGNPPSGQPPRPSGNAPSGVPPPPPSGQPPRPSGNPPSGQPPRPSGNAPSGVPPPPANDSVVGENRSEQPSGNPPSGQPPRPSGNAPSGVPPPPSGQPPRPSGNPPSGQPPRPSGAAPSGVPPPPPPPANDSVVGENRAGNPPSGQPPRPSGQPPRPSGNAPSGVPPPPPSESASPSSSDADSESEEVIELSNPELVSSACGLTVFPAVILAALLV